MQSHIFIYMYAYVGMLQAGVNPKKRKRSEEVDPISAAAIGTDPASG